ncbi:helix-turn-helix domain-containing protein [Enterovirga rhinocerotis]|uniref:Putative transcriptional regulator n=1 Tax=Enterovirga rhinocerotis TaxID=1339210 RepID=A0A4R7C7F5_9HYPH|nr:helix-turn-helix domain-containing protein [Enterovirga rhinocerotis]TDR94570.1 putative transcriptional regulator [Enterovirga rhinocerotis]
MTSLGKRLIVAAKEARSIARGEADPSSYRVHVPATVDVAGIRAGLRMTQTRFAEVFGFSAGTIRDWEQGRRQPDTAARAYLKVIEREPEIVRKALADQQTPTS